MFEDGKALGSSCIVVGISRAKIDDTSAGESQAVTDPPEEGRNRRDARKVIRESWVRKTVMMSDILLTAIDIAGSSTE